MVNYFSGVCNKNFHKLSLLPVLVEVLKKCFVTKLVLAAITSCYARFTLANPTPRLASDVVGGKSGQNHPTLRRDPIHIGRTARNAYICVGWYGEGILFITTPCERQLHCTRSAPDRLVASGNIKHV